MKNIFCAIACLALSQISVYSQKIYWETANIFSETGRYKGIKLVLNDNVELEVFTNSSVTIGADKDFKALLQDFFNKYDLIKDSIDENKANKIYFFSGSKSSMTITPGKEVKPTYIVYEGRAMQLNYRKDTILMPLKNNTRGSDKVSVFSFRMNRFEDLRPFANSNIINEFVDKVNKEILAKGKQQAVTYGINFREDGTFPSRYKGVYQIKENNVIGTLQKVSNASYSRKNLAVIGAASLQNYKSYFAPSFDVSLNVFFRGYAAKNSALRLGMYWQPVFIFEKNANNLKTFRNDFVGLIYEYRKAGTDGNSLSFYAPMSIAYLVHRGGNFYDKNSFNVGIGGIKYGAMTLRPFMNFNGFFKNVTPSVQVSIGLGLYGKD